MNVQRAVSEHPNEELSISSGKVSPRESLKERKRRRKLSCSRNENVGGKNEKVEVKNNDKGNNSEDKKGRVQKRRC